MPILSFADDNTEKFFKTAKAGKSGWSNVSSVAKRKLDMVHYAVKLSDLKAPPNNRLEALKDDLAGHHSIRVNDQWRIVFIWTNAGAREVRITDYH